MCPPPKDPIKYAEYIKRQSESHMGQKSARKGIILSEETKTKMSLSKQGMYGGEKNPFYGKKHSTSAIKSITDAAKSQSKERALVMKCTMTGRTPWNLGIPISESTRIKLSESQKGEKSHRFGKHQTEQAKDAIREAQKGKIYTESTLLKISNSRKGKCCGENNPRWGTQEPLSETTKEKISLKLKGENNPNYKDGCTALYNLIRRLPKMTKWRNAVFKKDNYTDHYSGCKPTGSNQLEAHHITPFHKLLKQYKIETVDDAKNCKALWDINNGITMLKTSHRAYHNMYGVDYE